jgi:hypothetical protein
MAGLLTQVKAYATVLMKAPVSLGYYHVIMPPFHYIPFY